MEGEKTRQMNGMNDVNACEVMAYGHGVWSR